MVEEGWRRRTADAVARVDARAHLGALIARAHGSAQLLPREVLGLEHFVRAVRDAREVAWIRLGFGVRG